MKIPKPQTLKKPDPARVKELRIKRQFNLTMEEYNLLGNVCAICGRTGKTREIAVDHNHKTGETRGRLCMTCNKGIALFRDDPELLNKAANYLVCPPVIMLFGQSRFGRTGRTNKKVGKKKNK